MTSAFQLRRRALLKSGGLVLFAAGSSVLPSLAQAHRSGHSQGKRKKILVTIFQRFGMDGVLAVTPYADAGLARLRPNLMLSAPGSGRPDARLELGNELGLHPAFAPMMPLYHDGRLAIIQAVGQPDPTRSHDIAQRWWETGTPGDHSREDGWLGRAQLQLRNPALLPAVALTAERPRIFYGKQAVTATATVDSLLPAPGSEALLAQLQTLYRQSSRDALQQAALDSLALGQLLQQQPQSSVAYPENSRLGDSLRDIARLIKADVGLQLAFAESRESPNGKGTWDTHANASSTEAGGPFPPMAHDLSASLAAFMSDLGSYQDDVVVITHTDFGRNVVENPAQGTDHGRATTMFVLGSPVQGGQVYGSLPERFDRDVLEDGMDLPVTTDYRSVVVPILQSHLGLTDTHSIFPGWQGPGLEVI